MREQDWENALNEHLEKMRHTEFKRGLNDCALFVCDCILAMTGKDFASDYRGQYTTRKQAEALIKKHGNKDLKSLATEQLGEPYTNINFAKRGDVVLVPCPEGEALAILDLTGKRAVTTGKDGLVYYPREQWIKAWSL